MINSLIS